MVETLGENSNVSCGFSVLPHGCKNGLLCLLPTEIQFMIKNNIAPNDLRTHVCFYLTHPDIAELYESEKDPDEFWKHVCWLCGLGLLPNEDEKEAHEISWKAIAIDCIIKDGFCKHEECGENILEYNSKWYNSCIFTSCLDRTGRKTHRARVIYRPSIPARGYT